MKWGSAIAATCGPPSFQGREAARGHCQGAGQEPRLIFADEPTSALDKTNGEIVIDLLKKIAAEHGATVLGVTHDPRLLSHADRVIELEDGIVIRDRQQRGRPSANNLAPEERKHEYA
ncbi:hypothetical protein ACU4HD_14980 [Cupriavidus basilensis]